MEDANIPKDPKVPKVPTFPDVSSALKMPDINFIGKPNADSVVGKSMTDDISLSSVKKGVTDKLKETSKNLNANSIKAFFSDGLYAGLFAVIVISAIAAYILYRYIASAIFNQSRLVIEKTKTPIVCNKLSQISVGDFNKSGNGKRRTYTFWIYIHDLNKYSGSYRHVFHIGDANDVKSASPYVFLDKSENKLYFRIAATDRDSMGDISLSSVQNISDTNLNMFMAQGIVIPYIPIQRWVHVAVVVNENSNGGSIISYVDGEISKIVTSGEVSDTGSRINIANLNLDKMGDLFVGGSFDSPSGPGFSGLISKITMFNYDLNNKDIYDDYNRGPLDGFMASMGMSRYGLRTPIYKIE